MQRTATTAEAAGGTKKKDILEYHLLKSAKSKYSGIVLYSSFIFVRMKLKPFDA
jgi:hypothetical protein